MPSKIVRGKEDVMPALQVKDCPAEVYERLRECAARENRSISQQTVTILEEHLGMRPKSNASMASMSTESRHGRNRPRYLYSNEQDDGVDYAAKHRAVFAELEKLPPIPITDSTQDIAAFIAQMREEDAE